MIRFKPIFILFNRVPNVVLGHLGFDQVRLGLPGLNNEFVRFKLASTNRNITLILLLLWFLLD